MIAEAQQRKDRELRDRVVRYLHQKNLHSLRRLDVEVSRGAVVLRGQVNSFYEKQLCLHCCQRVAGVIHLVDRISVPYVPASA